MLDYLKCRPICTVTTQTWPNLTDLRQRAKRAHMQESTMESVYWFHIGWKIYYKFIPKRPKWKIRHRQNTIQKTIQMQIFTLSFVRYRTIRNMKIYTQIRWVTLRFFIVVAFQTINHLYNYVRGMSYHLYKLKQYIILFYVRKLINSLWWTLW